MANMTFSNPSGQQITINSPDGSTPSEGELDQLFSQSNSENSDNSEPQEETEKISDIQAQQPQVSPQQNNPNSTGNPITDISGDLARGLINSGASAVNEVNGVVKLLKGVTHYDLGTDNLTNVSNKLKQLAVQQPQSSNPIVSGIGQFAGSIPEALAEFAGTATPVGFIGRSAGLAAASAYNKSQTPTALIGGAALGATVGAVLNKVPDVIEGAGNLTQKWGQTAGKKYLQTVTGATDKEADEIINNLPDMNIDPKSKIEDYDEAKKSSQAEISNLKDNNNTLIQQQKDQNTKEFNAAKSNSDDAVNSLIENNRDTIDNLRENQSQQREDLSSSTSSNMMAANDSAIQKLSDATTQTTINGVKARNALDSTLVSTFDTASKKLDSMTKGVAQEVSDAHASLDRNGLSYAQMPIVQVEADNAIARGSGKFFKMTRTSDGKGMFLSPMPGTQTPAITKGIELINSVRSHLVNDFMNSGKTSLAAIEANRDMLEGAIQKGFNGNSIPEGLASVMADLRKSINPSNLYAKYPEELSHLKPLADANKSFSTQIDGLRNALNLYKDNVDGTINPQKVFDALDKNKSGYLAQLKQADEALPAQDRIFNKVKDSYDKYKSTQESEKLTLSKTQNEVAKQRKLLSSKFDSMRKQLRKEQTQELIGKRTQLRLEKREFTQQQGKQLEDLHSRQRQALEVMQSQKDKELNALQQSIDERLHSLHLLHMVRGSRADAQGNARIFQNVANYRTIDGMSSLNVPKMVQGSLMSKLASPAGAAGTVKAALKAPELASKINNFKGREVLKRLIATKTNEKGINTFFSK